MQESGEVRWRGAELDRRRQLVQAHRQRLRNRWQRRAQRIAMLLDQVRNERCSRVPDGLQHRRVRRGDHCFDALGRQQGPHPPHFPTGHIALAGGLRRDVAAPHVALMSPCVVLKASQRLWQPRGIAGEVRDEGLPSLVPVLPEEVLDHTLASFLQQFAVAGGQGQRGKAVLRETVLPGGAIGGGGLDSVCCSGRRWRRAGQQRRRFARLRVLRRRLQEQPAGGRANAGGEEDHRA